MQEFIPPPIKPPRELDEDTATGADPISQVTLQRWPQTGADMTVHSVRICYGVDLYGDSATITVPTLPLGIV